LFPALRRLSRPHGTDTLSSPQQRDAAEHCTVLVEGLLLRPSLPARAPSLEAFVRWLDEEEAAMTEEGGRETRPWVVVDGSSVASSEYDDL